MLMHEIDVLREVNPSGQDYTRYLSSHSVDSWIDYFFMFEKDLYKLDKCEISPSLLSDHSLVYVLFLIIRLGLFFGS